MFVCSLLHPPELDLNFTGNLCYYAVEESRLMKLLLMKLLHNKNLRLFFIKSCNNFTLSHYQCNNNWPLVAGITYFYFNTLVVITVKIEIIKVPNISNLI